MKQNARARSAHGVTHGNGPSIDIQFFLIKSGHGRGKAQLVLSIAAFLPGTQTANHLRGKGLVNFPKVDVLHLELMALQKWGCRMNGAKAHLRGVKPRPLKINQSGKGL